MRRNDHHHQERQSANPFRVNAYRKAARTVVTETRGAMQSLLPDSGGQLRRMCCSGSVEPRKLYR